MFIKDLDSLFVGTCKIRFLGKVSDIIPDLMFDRGIITDEKNCSFHDFGGCFGWSLLANSVPWYVSDWRSAVSGRRSAVVGRRVAGNGQAGCPESGDRRSAVADCFKIILIKSFLLVNI
jgi:hypothetical protein